MSEVILKTEMPDIGEPRRGKVRDIYDLGENLLLVVTDRVSAFDVVLPNGIPDKGRVLTAISVFWFRQMEDIAQNHIVSTEISEFPEELHKYRHMLEGRSLLVKKAKVIPIECIVRGYLSGSGWRSYKSDGTLCGIKLPQGLLESSRLPMSLFTPSTKAEEGHDINISFEKTKEIVGTDIAETLMDISRRVYKRACDIAEQKGIIIADTKMEFGTIDGKVILIDELLTPDSSRFWSMKDYRIGRGQDSFDKQIIRDYLLTLDWNQMPPGPPLPEHIIEKTRERYREILRILTD
ncbi:MAG: phosphoribosylaminoimidazolesuccinocarboxamide synthase [Nitrospirae bacterium]|nr:phosphoribosylaminoimidazolesuccinocarboxamide synthase [Nitrospirota bacterium]